MKRERGSIASVLVATLASDARVLKPLRRHARLIVRKALDGRTWDQAADYLGVSRNTIARLARALKGDDNAS